MSAEVDIQLLVNGVLRRVAGASSETGSVYLDGFASMPVRGLGGSVIVGLDVWRSAVEGALLGRLYGAAHRSAS